MVESTISQETADGTSAQPDPAASPAAAVKPADDTSLVEVDLLVEEVSIDGMCGVY